MDGEFEVKSRDGSLLPFNDVMTWLGKPGISERVESENLCHLERANR